MARLERFELPTNWFEASYSIQLSYRRVGLLCHVYRVYTAYLEHNRVEPTLCRIADELRVLGAAFAIDRL